MALQNGYDDEDWINWGNIPNTTDQTSKNESLNVLRTGNGNKHESPKKDFNKDCDQNSKNLDCSKDNMQSNRNESRSNGGSEHRIYKENSDKGELRRNYSTRDPENSDFDERRSNRCDDKVHDKRDFNSRSNDRHDFKGRGNFDDKNDFKNRRNGDDGHNVSNQRNNNAGDDLAKNFQNKTSLNDEGHSRTFFRGKKEGDKDVDKEENCDEPQVPKRATYVPNDDEQDYELHVNSGINFDNYEKIPVEVTGESIPHPINKFSDFEMPEFLRKNVESMKYTKLTPVQKYAIPIIEADRDLMACAQTGSGKTAAFLLPIIVSLFKNKIATEESTAHVAFPKALIMAPTRELCRQIFTAARQLCQGSDLKCAYIYGGIEMNKSRRNLQSSGCDILVATPGRLIHFLELVWVSLRYLRYFVLDEGDRMLDKEGFFESVNKISEEANFTGPNRVIQISMFSATFPSEIQNLAKNILKNYLFLAVGVVGSANTDVKQEIIRAEQKDKMALAIEYIKSIPNEKTLVFVQSKRMADFVGIKLDYLGYKATTIHGDREQEQRETALNDFKSGRVNFMVATNVAARGLDIPMVDTVINIDMPDDIDTYVHRIGRTGRCGNVGRAVSFFDESNDIGLAAALVHRLQEANQECPDWLKLLSGGSSSSKSRPTFAKDNRRDMKVSKFTDTPGATFMKGTNADYNDDQDDWNPKD